MQEKYEKDMSNTTTLPVKVLIAAAGSGSRCGGDIPKQYQVVAGKPVLRHTLEKFLSLPEIDEIRVIINPEDAEAYHAAVTGVKMAEPIHGGNSRKNSVYNGLKVFSDSQDDFKILIHDAARPFVSPQDIHAVIAALDTHGAVTLAKPVSDTLRHDDNGMVDRNGFWAVQTPQGFRFQTIWSAHQALKDRDDFTDDTALITDQGDAVHMVETSAQNFKITTQDDMAMAEVLLGSGTETFTGQGFDVHAFDDAPAGAVRLCGIDVAHDKKLKGHSDADVAMHALTDAILGAIGAGDIGQHFPPSDDQWKGKDSAYFLQEAVRMVHEKGAKIANMDVTIICEAPKIGPHKEAMRERLSDITGVAVNRINVKATTTEQLGFTGRREGIAAQAIASIRIPMHNDA